MLKLAVYCTVTLQNISFSSSVIADATVLGIGMVLTGIRSLR
jgi:hypothetical protein